MKYEIIAISLIVVIVLAVVLFLVFRKNKTSSTHDGVAAHVNPPTITLPTSAQAQEVAAAVAKNNAAVQNLQRAEANSIMGYFSDVQKFVSSMFANDTGTYRVTTELKELYPNNYIGGGQKIVSVDDPSGKTYCALNKTGLFYLTSPYGTTYFNSTPASYVLLTPASQLVLIDGNRNVICYQSSPDVGTLYVRGTGQDMRIVFTDYNGNDVASITTRIGNCTPPTQEQVQTIIAKNNIISTWPTPISGPQQPLITQAVITAPPVNQPIVTQPVVIVAPTTSYPTKAAPSSPPYISWLSTPDGQAWLNLPQGASWLSNPDNQGWLNGIDGQSWLNTTAGQNWSATPAGVAYSSPLPRNPPNVDPTLVIKSSVPTNLIKVSIYQEFILGNTTYIITNVSNTPINSITFNVGINVAFLQGSGPLLYLAPIVKGVRKIAQYESISNIGYTTFYLNYVWSQGINPNDSLIIGCSVAPYTLTIQSIN
jgi:hypothetical protein